MFSTYQTTSQKKIFFHRCEEAICCLVQQANEKIDRTRGVALTTLTALLLHTPTLPHIPHHTILKEIFCK